MSNYRSIIFSQNMVNKVVENKKTIFIIKTEFDHISQSIKECIYKTGDILLLKEKWAIHPEYNNIVYQNNFIYTHDLLIKWNTPVLLKKENTRINLCIKKIEFKKIENLTELDAQQNGNDKSTYPDEMEDSDPETGYFPPRSCINDFAYTWDQKYGKGSFDKSKESVWLIHFETIINK